MKLTEQEKEAFELYTQGNGIAEIALIIGVSYQQAVNIMNSVLTKSPYKSAKELLANANSIEIED